MSILIENISKQFGEKTVLDSINLEIKTGSLVALLGGSGSGKSTLLRIVAGFEAPDNGRVWLHGKDASTLAIQEKEIGFVFQAYALFQHLTVYENIAFGGKSKPNHHHLLSSASKGLTSCFSCFAEQAKQAQTNQLQSKGLAPLAYGGGLAQQAKQDLQEGKQSKQNKAKVEELLRLVRLEELAHRYPSQLSGGQRQRVALARALAVQPKVLLLDEPFGALDMKVRKQLRRWLRQLHERVGVTTLFVTHDHQEAMEVANEIVVLDKGRVKHSLQSPQKIYQLLRKKPF